MPRVGFEPTIPLFVRAKTVHALGRAASVIAATYTVLSSVLVRDMRNCVQLQYSCFIVISAQRVREEGYNWLRKRVHSHVGRN
jgi:hypothetical protein